jgi:D-alanyl-D-alanine carboxypeptidase (penicillin-binding protein 5/6)
MTSGDPQDGMTQFADLLRTATVDDVWEDPAVDAARRARRRRRRRGWLVALLVVALVIAAGAGYVGYALNAPVAAPTAVTRTPVAEPGKAVTLALPSEGASAVTVSGGAEYFGAGASGTDASGIRAASGGDGPRPLASVTKLVTALVVLDAKPLDDANDPGPTLQFSRADHALYDEYYVQNATIAPMPTGSRMSQRDALEMMLVVSASNYAAAVARWAFGSQWAFVRAANRWLDAHGLEDTTIVEPTGIDKRNTSTASDLVALGDLGMADPTIAAIVGMRSLDVPGFSGSNTNTLLGTSGIRGLKTGTLRESGANLVYSSLLDVGIGEPLEVTGAVLGGGTRESVARSVVSLLDSIRRGFRDVPVATRGDSYGVYSTLWGAEARMVLAADAAVFTWSDTPIAATMTTTQPQTFLAGEKVGSITWTAGVSSATVDLVLDADIEPPDSWWRLTHALSPGG